MKTSTQLDIGRVYTREQLRQLFTITDATLNTGIFRPSGTDSVWLFVTEHKTPDRPPYFDRLDGDVLEWDSQPTGRKDSLILDHARLGLELLLFYRTHKYEHRHAGFTYLGPFRYGSHSGAAPTHFKLLRGA